MFQCESHGNVFNRNPYRLVDKEKKKSISFSTDDSIKYNTLTYFSCLQQTYSLDPAKYHST